MSPKHEFTVGIEEEFFLVDLETFDCIEIMPEEFRREAKATLGNQVKREVISSMIEINSGVHARVRDAVAEIGALREALGRIASRNGIGLVAAGTHPFADWRRQTRTQTQRYDSVAEALQMLAKRIHVCGLHIHVGVSDRDARIDLMNRMQRFLPLVLALSASSPFWRGDPTGLKCYRVTANGESPRSGLPGWFANADEFDRYVAKLVAAGFMPDASYLWWLIRPSSGFPTLEMRVADCCTRVRDVAALAALYQSLLYHLKHNRADARDWEHHYHLVNEENIWQAIRYGTEARFVDAASGVTTTLASWARDVTSLVSESARRLGCLSEVLSVTHILSEGSSADVQMRTYEAALASGATQEEALRKVTKQLAQLTVPALEWTGQVNPRSEEHSH